MSQAIFILNGEWVIIINIKWRAFNSIKFKLFGAFILIGVLPLIMFSVTLFSSIQFYYQNENKQGIYRLSNTIAINLVATNFFVDTDSYDFLENVKTTINGTIMILDKTGKVVYDSNHQEENMVYMTKEVFTALEGKLTDVYLKEENLIKVVTPIKDTAKNEIIGVVILTSSFDAITTSIERFQRIAYFSVVGLLLFILIINYYFTGQLTKPFKHFIEYLDRVTVGHLDEDFSMKGNYEIEEIGTAFNHMLQRLRAIEENRQRFVADVSHELKTPLTSMKVLAETLLQQEDAPLAYYQEFMQDISDEVDRENKIINDLLTLVTLDKPTDSLNSSIVNINALLEQVMRRLRPIANVREIEMELKSYRNVVAEVDETKMALVFVNLIENAIKYNCDHGKVSVVLNADHRDFMLMIADTGVGIPIEYQEQIFDRFFRVDKTRSRDTGGTGLGLSIVHKTIMMHRGTIKCESNEGEGSSFTIKVPLKFRK